MTNLSSQIIEANHTAEEEEEPLIVSPLEMSSDLDEKKKACSFLLRNYNSRRRLLMAVTGIFAALLMLHFWLDSRGKTTTRMPLHLVRLGCIAGTNTLICRSLVVRVIALTNNDDAPALSPSSHIVFAAYR